MRIRTNVSKHAVLGFAAGLWLCPAVSLYAVVDLSDQSAWFRPGFSVSWTTEAPGQGAGWRLVNRGAGLRSLRIRDIVPGDNKRRFMSFTSPVEREYTIIQTFRMEPGHKVDARVIGLFLAHIGVNWEVYLNGHLVRREIHRQSDGTIGVYRSLRGILLALPHAWLRDGDNVVSFRIVGDPGYTATGLSRAGPYLIDDYEHLVLKSLDLGGLALLPLYGGVGVFHLFLYFRRRQDKHNLWLGIFSLLLTAYLLARSNVISTIIEDTSIVRRVELALAFCILPVGAIIVDRLVRGRVSIFTRVLCVVSGVVCLPVFLVHLSLTADIVSIWQAAAPVPVAYILFQVSVDFAASAREKRQRGTGLVAAAFAALADSRGGNLLVGITLTGLAALYDIYDSWYLHEGIEAAKYAFFVCISGSAVMTANRFLKAQEDVRRLNDDLRGRISAVDVASRTLAHSEEKYRVLVEGSKDIIFSLDREWRITRINRVISRDLGIEPDDVLGRPLVDLIFDEEDGGITRELIREKLEQSAGAAQPFTLKAPFRSVIGEPAEYTVRLEYAQVDGKTEMIGRASNVIEDALLKSFESERQKFVIGNYLTTAEDLSQRLVRNAARYMDTHELAVLRIALREMIINAIEHGNLAITSEEKTAALKEASYRALIRARQQDVRFKDRRVLVEYAVNPARVVYRITDQGRGFDHAAIRARTPKDLVGDQMLHGRGIMLAQNVFDSVNYNASGNQVVLIKRFEKS